MQVTADGMTRDYEVNDHPNRANVLKRPFLDDVWPI